MTKPASSRRGFARGAFAGGLLLLFASLARAQEGAPPDAVQPPPIQLLRSEPGTARGLIFVAPRGGPALPKGPQIVDSEGRTVWFMPMAPSAYANDFRVQRYRGEPVLTWIQGETTNGVVSTTDYIVNRSYEVVASVRAGNGFDADGHEFRITSEDTALIPVYATVPFDLSPYGGPVDGQVIEGVIQEIHIPTGRVLFEWHSLDHIGLDESYPAVPQVAGRRYDYLHINSVSVDRDGDLLVSARHTWALYKIDRRSGRIIWRLGGKKSDFALAPEASFSWQHDVQASDRSTLRFFDNHAAGSDISTPSRVLWLRRNRRDDGASLIRAIQHPDGIIANAMGNAQGLPNGNTFVGWGVAGRVSEFDREGELLFDAQLPAGYFTYRAYRSPWHGHPATRPTARAQRNADGTVRVHALWNGATDVARWYVVGGRQTCELWPLGSAEWDGLDTELTIDTDAHEVAVVARDARGRWIGRSAPVAVEDAPSLP